MFGKTEKKRKDKIIIITKKDQFSSGLAGGYMVKFFLNGCTVLDSKLKSLPNARYRNVASCAQFLH